MTEKGLNMITESGEDPEFFILPDIGVKLAEIEKADTSTDEKLKQKEVVLNDYAQKAIAFTPCSNY